MPHAHSHITLTLTLTMSRTIKIRSHSTLSSNVTFSMYLLHSKLWQSHLSFKQFNIFVPPIHMMATEFSSKSPLLYFSFSHIYIRSQLSIFFYNNISLENYMNDQLIVMILELCQYLCMCVFVLVVITLWCGVLPLSTIKWTLYFNIRCNFVEYIQEWL